MNYPFKNTGTNGIINETTGGNDELKGIVMEKLNPPSPMQLVGNLADNWKRFKQRFNIYFAASGAGGDDEKLKASIFLHVIGEDALDIYNSFQLDEANLTLTVLMTKFEKILCPKQECNV